MSNVKKYVLTAVTLGLIAMASGLLIGATNMITADRIAENEVKKINASFVEIYGEGTTGTENESFDFNNYTYLKAQYEIFDGNGENIGMAYRTLGSNAYGKVSLIVGFSILIANMIAVVLDHYEWSSSRYTWKKFLAMGLLVVVPALVIFLVIKFGGVYNG